MYGQDEMVDIFTEWRSTDIFNHTLGACSLNGNQYVLDAAPSDNGATHNTWLLFGDPSMMVRSANPTEMNVSVNPTALMIGMSTLEISAETEYGIATLSNDEGVVASAKIIDGTANLEFAPLSAVETLTLTVIGYNKVTEVLNVEVLPAQGAYVSVDAFTPGNVPVNEEQLMSITFKNVGVDPTTGTTNVTLSCEDENLTFTDNEASFGVLAANETITLTDEFAFTVAPGVPDGTRIQIDINMTCGTQVWTGKAKITVGAPIIEFGDFQCIGGFTPGESQNVAVSFNNVGHYMATNAVITASSQNQYVSFANESVEVGTIEAEGSCVAMFNVMIDEACSPTDVIDLTFDLVADNDITATGEGSLKNSCNVVFNLTDSYGDGWNGNQLTVAFSDGTPTQNLTIQTGNSATYTLSIGIGVTVTLGWITGSYASECSFTVSYEGGDQITSAQAPNSSYSYQFTVNCGGDPGTTVLTPVGHLQFELDTINRTLILTWVSTKDAVNFLVTRNGEQIGQTTDNVFIDNNPIESCEYCVIAQYLAGNSEPSCLEVGEVWGIEENESSIRIFPNPVKNVLYIKGGNDDYSYVLYNGMGQAVANGIANGTQQIDCSNFGKGIYFLHLTTGAQVRIEKVVVK